MASTGLARRERALEWAHAFVQEVRGEIEAAALKRHDVPPRLRSVHERAGHATPEYRTLAVQVPEGAEGASPEVLSGLIARFARAKPASCLILVFDAVMESASGDPQPVLIAEVRDRIDARFFLVQPFEKDGGGGVRWAEPLEGGWRDPGDEEMILDGAFRR